MRQVQRSPFVLEIGRLNLLVSEEENEVVDIVEEQHDRGDVVCEALDVLYLWLVVIVENVACCFEIGVSTTCYSSNDILYNQNALVDL